MHCLAINLSDKPRWFQLAFCCMGVFFGFLINGVCEEYIFKTLEFSYAWYFTFAQSLVYIALAYAHGFRPRRMMQPWAAYFKLAFVLVGSMGLTKASLRYINYPAQLMFKSSKVLPVMLLGRLVPGLRRTYSPLQYASAALLVGGLVAFTRADAAAAPTFEPAGVAMIVGALVFDAFLGNLQEVLFESNHATTQTEVLFCSTSAGLLFLALPMVLTGELWDAWEAGLKIPHVYAYIGLAAASTYIGQLAVLSLVALFGAATTYMVTSIRKALTLALSYIIFTKPFSLGHLTGFLLIAVSLSMRTCSQQPKAKSPAGPAVLPIFTAPPLPAISPRPVKPESIGGTEVINADSPTSRRQKKSGQQALLNP